jgi:hypothetical protein
MKMIKSFRIDRELWEKFSEKHKKPTKKIRELIQESLENKKNV